MSINANAVHLMGNLTRDPELITSDRNGNQLDNAICNFGIATNRQYRNRESGKLVQETCFVDNVAFGRQAEVVHEFCKKGTPVYVQGYLRLDQWQDNGTQRQKLKVVAERVNLLGAGNGNGNGNNGNGTSY